MPKIVEQLTDLAIKSFKFENPQDTQKKKSAGGGLYVLFHKSKSGFISKIFKYKYRVQGQPDEITIGNYGPVGRGVSLADARAEHARLKALVRQGINPRVARQNEIVAVEEEHRRVENTFALLSDLWLAKMKVDGWSDGHHLKSKQRIAKHLLPVIGELPVSDITELMVVRLLEGIVSEGYTDTSHRLKCYMEKIFSFAKTKRLIQENPVKDVDGILPKKQTIHRTAFTKEDDFKRLVRGVWSYDGDFLTRSCLKIIVLTARRIGEVRQMEWTELDFDFEGGPIWIVPKEKTKMKRQEVVPITQKVKDIIDDLRNITGRKMFVFPNKNGKIEPMSNNTPLVAIRRMGFAKEETTTHGIRSSFKTIAGKHRQNYFITEKILSHKTGTPIGNIYDRPDDYEYVGEMREVLNWWEGLVVGMLS